MEPEFVVRTDRAGVNRRHRGIIMVHVALTGFVVAMMVVLGVVAGDAGLPAYAFAPFLIVLLGQTFQIGIHCFIWGARTAIDRPLVITPRGLVFTVAQGRAEVPWEAISQVDIRSLVFGQAMRFRLHPQAAQGGPGLHVEIAPKTWRLLVKRGILLGSRGIDCELQQIRQVITQASAGRVPV